jgi:branched-chain amino acid transport system substrate-binding protein
MTKAVVLALALAAALVPAGAGAADPFAIPVILSLTGPGAFLGKNTQVALNVVADGVNKTGGIGGRTIEFAVQDDQSNPQVSVQLLNGILDRHPSLVMGSTLVASCSAMAALLKNGPVEFCFSGGMHPDKGSYVFSYGADTTTYARVAQRYFRERGWKRIAILTTTDASGKDGERVTDAALALPENKDVVVVDREYFAVTDVSVTAQIEKIKASGAQAVVVWGTGTPLGTVFNGMKNAGLDIPVAMSASNLIFAEMKQFAPIMPRQLYAAGPPCTALDALPRGKIRTAVTDFIDAFKAAGIHADAAESVGYDPAQIVVAAYKKLGLSATPAQIRDYIAGLHDWTASVGEYDFRDGSQKGSVESSTMVVRVDPSGDNFIGVSKLGGDPLTER